MHLKVVYKSGKEVTPDPVEFSIAKTRGAGEFRKEGNQLRIFRGGRTWISVSYGGLSKEFETDIRGFEVVEDYDEFLKTPTDGASLVVPVVIINYLPTEDGINLDMNRAPDDYWQLPYSTLEEANARINVEFRTTKFGIEEGTRYRQFARQERVEFFMVNNQLWKSRQYDFNLTNNCYTRGNRHFKDYRNHAELKWLIYWWQTIPGPSNGLAYRGQPLTNWWDVFYNWDEVIQSSGDLVKRNNARKGEVKMQGNFPVCIHAGLKPLGR